MEYFHGGNPYKYGGWTYEWQADLQPKSMTHKKEQDAQDKKSEFSYDAKGLRTQIKYTFLSDRGQTVVETTDYILHGKLLAHQKTTTVVDGIQQDELYQLHFYYDAAGRLIMAQMGSEEPQSKYYAYIGNLQGDVLGIIDRGQDSMVEYSYSQWGEVLEARSLITEREKLNHGYLLYGSRNYPAASKGVDFKHSRQNSERRSYEKDAYGNIGYNIDIVGVVWEHVGACQVRRIIIRDFR